MTAILGTWNPSKWPWSNRAEAMRDIASGVGYRGRWSVDRRRHGISIGDRFFLLKQTVEPRGIVASGTIASLPATDIHWNKRPGATTNYVTIDYDTIVDPDDVLPMDRLVAELPRTHWTPQGSGTTVNPADESVLERLWAQHIRLV